MNRKINPVEPPYVHGEPPGSAALKTVPEDFQVEEILGFTPSGEGEHCFVFIEKREKTSNEVAAIFAETLGIRKRLIAHCGLKDKHAITRQWFSIHLPGEDSPSAQQLKTDEIDILKITRGTRKLRRGIHQGNRFIIRLRDVEGAGQKELEARWEKICGAGVPNYFGAQRFGKSAGNLAQARRLFSGELEVRDRLFRGLLLSSARSALFNAQVGRRVEEGTWDRPLPGEVFGFAGNRSLILPDNLRGDEVERFSTGEIELTAPLWGGGDLHSAGEVQSNESVPFDQDFASGLEAAGLVQERRVMRMTPQDPQLSWDDSGDLLLEFALPKGGYATTILRELVHC